MHSSLRVASRTLARALPKSTTKLTPTACSTFTPLLSRPFASSPPASASSSPALTTPPPAPFIYSGPLPLVQQAAPAFGATAVINKEFKPITLSQYRGQWVILFFYPLDFTFVCPTEIIAFSDRSAEFAALNCQLLTASTDSEYSHLAWVNTPREQGGLGNITIPMIADITKSISASYGVLLPQAGVALRGLFIIDPEGVVRQSTVNDLPIGRSVDETLRLLKALQFVEKHGEVCPADWKEGGETMVASPEASKTYFKKVNK